MRTPNINHTIQNDLCTGCGVCEAICPQTAIKTVIKNGRFLPKIDDTLCNNNRGCHRCFDVCPGVGVNLISLAEDNFNDDGVLEDKMAGRFLRCYTGYSSDFEVRYHSASGGMVSQFLIWLLDKKYIDGAIVTRIDNKKPLMVESFIATSREEIISARSSKYSPVSLHKALCDLKKADGGNYVVVGLPCHIQGVRKLMATDKRIREKVSGLFAIYCSCGRTFYMTEHIFKERGIKQEHLNYFQYRDEGCLGKMVAKCPLAEGNTIRVMNANSESVIENNERVYKEHYQSYYHPLRSFFIPRRCLLCIDHYGELGDISFGDIHIKPYSDDKIGINSLIVRKQLWLDLLEECKRDGAVVLDEVPFQTVSDSQPMSFKKKGRNGAFINICRKLGEEVPVYDVDYLLKPTFYDWLDYSNNRIQQFLGRHKWLWPIVSKMKSKVNIH